MRTTPPRLAFFAVVLLGLFGGCKTSDNTPEAKAATAEAPTPAPIEAAVAAPDPVAEPQEEAGGGDLRENKVRVLVEGFLDNARNALERGEIEAAHAALLHAFEMDPDNEEVQDMLDRVSVQRGEGGVTGATGRSAAELNQVRRAQAALEVERRVDESRRLREAGDLDGAVQALEDALLIVRWNPYLGADRAGHDVSSLEDRLQRLRIEQERQRRQRLAQREQRALAEKEEREQEERERIANQIRSFLASANDAFYRERFKEAETFCAQVLALDPTHEEALELKSIAAEARHASLQKEYHSQFRHHWRETFDDLEYDDLPFNELLSFPSEEDWDQIEKRGPLRFSLEQEAVPAEDQRVLDLLANQSIDINFVDTDLKSAIDWFRINTGANFIIDPAVLDESGDVTFNLTLPKMKVGRALDLLMGLSDAELGYRVRDGVVTIISAVDATGGQVLEIYDVRDLTKTITSFSSRDYDLKPSSVFEDIEDEEFDPAPIVIDSDALVDLILTNIDQDSWDADPNNTALMMASGALVVTQTPEVHRKIHKLLSDLRHNAGTLINIETRFMELEDRFLQDIGVDFRGLDGQNGSSATAAVPNVVLDDFGLVGAGGVGSPGFPEGIGTSSDAGAFFTEGGDLDVRGRLENLYDLSLGDEDFAGTGGLALEFTYLDDTQVEAILRAVEKSSMAEIINAQNLTVFNGQRANIVVQDHITYVKDFEVEIAQGAVIADPIVSVIKDGTILDVRPVVSSDRRFVTIEVRPTVANLVEPIPTFRTSLAVGNEIELQLPELRVQRLRTTVTIPDGATLMLGGMKTIIESQLESGIPFLKDIPIVSFFASRKGTEQTRKKLLILLRAQIIIPEEGEPGARS